MRGERPEINIDSHTITKFNNKAMVNLSGTITAGEGDETATVTVFVNGQEHEVDKEGESWKLSAEVNNVATTGEEADKVMVVLVAARSGVRRIGKMLLL